MKCFLKKLLTLAIFYFIFVINNYFNVPDIIAIKQFDYATKVDVHVLS